MYELQKPTSQSEAKKFSTQSKSSQWSEPTKDIQKRSVQNPPRISKREVFRMDKYF